MKTFVVIASALLISTSAWAQHRPRSTPAFSRLRGHSPALADASGLDRLGSAPIREAAVTKREEGFHRVAVGHVAKVAAAPAPSVLDSAVGQLSALAALRRPEASGPVQVFFSIGRDGHVVNAMVISVDRRLDELLEGRLRQQVFDPHQAGNVYATTFHLAPRLTTAKRSRR